MVGRQYITPNTKSNRLTALFRNEVNMVKATASKKVGKHSFEIPGIQDIQRMNSKDMQ